MRILTFLARLFRLHRPPSLPPYWSANLRAYALIWLEIDTAVRDGKDSPDARWWALNLAWNKLTDDEITVWNVWIMERV